MLALAEDPELPLFERIKFVAIMGMLHDEFFMKRISGLKRKLERIQAKMNQLQERHIIAELYRASVAGVPIRLNVRGLCCLRPQVPGLSENIEVFGVISRFLEHSRIYRFVNGGAPELYVGSADWRKRNLYRRVETIAPVADAGIRDELARILEVYERDNCTVWDGRPDGTYLRRRPAPGEEPRPCQETFIRLASK